MRKDWRRTLRLFMMLLLLRSEERKIPLRVSRTGESAMRYEYEWPLRYPDPVLNEALEIALDYLQGTGQVEPRDGAEHLVAASILSAWSGGMTHRIRLANAGIRAVEQKAPFMPHPQTDENRQPRYGH
jgi:hypothetical protein